MRLIESNSNFFKISKIKDVIYKIELIFNVCLHVETLLNNNRFLYISKIVTHKQFTSENAIK